jgi:hypothetical protein
MKKEKINIANNQNKNLDSNHKYKYKLKSDIGRERKKVFGKKNTKPGQTYPMFTKTALS